MVGLKNYAVTRVKGKMDKDNSNYYKADNAKKIENLVFLGRACNLVRKIMT